MREYHDDVTDRDGAVNPRYRLWDGDAAVGDRVKMKQEDAAKIGEKGARF